jgi:hypothetical protein
VKRHTTLYERLLKYAPSPGRTQLENFLSESLCDFFGRVTALDRGSIEGFVLDTLLNRPAQSKISERLLNAKTLDWSTQETVTHKGSRGFLDICLFADSRIILVIENKIAAGFTTHSLFDDKQQVQIRSQMEFYDEWLSSNFPDAGLVLLTHFTDAPPGFLESCQLSKVSAGATEERYKCQIRRMCKWTTIYEWLTRWHEPSESSPTAEGRIFLCSLAKEFLLFLEENNMSASKITSDDVQLLGSFFSQDIWKKVCQTATSARAIASPLLPNLWGQPKSPPQTNAWEGTQILWDWGYCYERELEWYVGWGFSGTNGLRHLDISLDSPMKAFVLVTSDRSDIPVTADAVRNARTAGWDVFEPGLQQKTVRLIKTVDAQQFTESPDGFSAAFERWHLMAMKEAVDTLEVAHRNLSR